MEDQVNAETLMTEYSEDLSIQMSENGLKSYHFSTPLMEGYAMARDPYKEFRKGVKVIMYEDDSTANVSATLTSNYAIFYDNRKLWEAKGDVGHAQGGMTAQLAADAGKGLQRHVGGIGGRADRHSQRVENDILLINAVALGGLQDTAGDPHPSLGGVGDARFVQGEGHHHAAVLLHQGKYRFHTFHFPIDASFHCHRSGQSRSRIHQ